MRSKRMVTAAVRAQLVADLRHAARTHSIGAILSHVSFAERFGLSPADATVLELLDHLGPLSPGELVRRTGFPSSSITSVIDRLELRGLVRRIRSRQDRRRVYVELNPTDVGRIMAECRISNSATDELWAPYSTTELEVLLDFIRRWTYLPSPTQDGSSDDSSELGLQRRARLQ
jgi:DNA-binding MarR family transcriptional regulator